MMKRTAFILSLTLGLACASRGQVMMLFTADSLSYITSPLAIDSLYYWFDASQGVTDSLGGAIANNEGVGQWNDLSGHGYHVTQGTNTARPVYKTGALAGYPGIQFDGSNDFLASAAHFWGSDDITFIVVMKFANATRDAIEVVLGKHTFTGNNRQFVFYGNNSANTYDLYFATDADGVSGSIGLAFSTSNDKHTNYALHIASSNGTSAEMRKDGAAITLTTNTPQTIYNSSSYGFIIGAADQASPQLYLQGTICEAMVWSKALSTAERVAIETYLNKKYDLY